MLWFDGLVMFLRGYHTELPSGVGVGYLQERERLDEMMCSVSLNQVSPG